MLSRHVVFRQSLRRCLIRSISTAADAPTPRPRGRPRKTSIAEEPTANAAPIELPIRRGPGRPRKVALVGNLPPAVVDAQIKRSSKSVRIDGQSSEASSKVDVPKRGRSKGKTAEALLTKRSRSPKPSRSSSSRLAKHWDLASFEEYALKHNLKKDTSVYRGNHYEYTVMEALKQYGFAMWKTGRANDLGIDLLGNWDLPAEPHELRVLVQCKASKPRPAYVRELEGAFSGAPAGWKDGNAMAMLITRDPATPGTIEALMRSAHPMAFAQITELGEMRQLYWNDAAQKSRLTGITATTMYGSGSGGLLSSSSVGGHSPGIIALYWEGKKWPSRKSSLHTMRGLIPESLPDNRLSV